MCSLHLGSSANTSVIYTRASKKAELFHPDSRFLILTSAALPPASDDTPTMPGSLPPRSKGKGKAADFELKEGELWGFCSFRFDMEETLEGDDVEVVYWWVALRPVFPAPYHALSS